MSEKDKLKKEIEALYLKNFLQGYDSALIDKIDPRHLEEPDFNIDTIGVELRYLYPDATRKGSALRDVDENKNTLRGALYEKLYKTNLPFLNISIDFLPNFYINKRDIKKIASTLLAILNAAIDKPNMQTSIESWQYVEGLPIQILPAGIDSLSFVILPQMQGHFISIGGAAWLSPLSVNAIQCAINDKEIKKKKYRVCSDFWLLLILESRKISGTYEIDSCLQGCYFSSFNKIFLFDTFTQKHYELAKKAIPSIKTDILEEA